jgi:hypothetical protein
VLNVEAMVLPATAQLKSALTFRRCHAIRRPSVGRDEHSRAVRLHDKDRALDIYLLLTTATGEQVLGTGRHAIRGPIRASPSRSHARVF